MTHEEFARQCFGNFFTRGKWAFEIMPTREIEEAIACISKSLEALPLLKQPMSFRKELEYVVNCHCRENNSDTPDFILAEYLADVLDAFDKTVARREKWYGGKCGNGAALACPNEHQVVS